MIAKGPADQERGVILRPDQDPPGERAVRYADA